MTPEREKEIRDCIATRGLVPHHVAGDVLTELMRIRLALDASEIQRAKTERALAMHKATHERRMPVPESNALRERAEAAEAALAESRAREVALCEAAKRASDEYDNEVDQAPFLAAKRDLDDVLADLSTAAREWRERVRAECVKDAAALFVHAATYDGSTVIARIRALSPTASSSRDGGR